jgi:hypothetical protein
LRSSWIGIGSDRECGRGGEDEITQNNAPYIGRRVQSFVVIDRLCRDARVAIRVAHQVCLQDGVVDGLRVLVAAGFFHLEASAREGVARVANAAVTMVNTICR